MKFLVSTHRTRTTTLKPDWNPFLSQVSSVKTPKERCRDILGISNIKRIVFDCIVGKEKVGNEEKVEPRTEVETVNEWKQYFASSYGKHFHDYTDIHIFWNGRQKEQSLPSKTSLCAFQVLRRKNIWICGAYRPNHNAQFGYYHPLTSPSRVPPFTPSWLAQTYGSLPYSLGAFNKQQSKRKVEIYVYHRKVHNALYLKCSQLCLVDTWCSRIEFRLEVSLL